MTTIDFYRTQLSEMRTQAAAANLPSVRERCERSAAAWQAMIDRHEGFERQKAANIVRRAAG